MVTARTDEGRRQERWATRATAPKVGAAPAAALVELLNSFVRLAGERYRRAGLYGEAIRIYLHLEERQPLLHIADYSAGLTGPDLHKLARRLLADVGGTGYGVVGRADVLPHFGGVAEQCDIVSVAGAGNTPWRLSMTRGFSHYTVRADGSALRALEGTDVYLRGVNAEMLAGVTARSLAEALQPGNHGPLLEGAYALQVCGSGDGVWVSPFRSGGVPLMLPPISTAWGPIYLALSAHETAQLPAAPIILRGDRKQLVLGDVTAIPDLDVEPWTAGRLSGEITFPCLRRNPLQTNAPGNRQRLNALVGALESVQPQIQRDLDEQAAAHARARVHEAPVAAASPAPTPDAASSNGTWGSLRAHFGRLIARITS